MTPAERKLLRAICDLPERTLVGKPRRGIWSLGTEWATAVSARWQTFNALQQYGYIALTDGAHMASYVEATDAGRQAISGGAQ